MTERNADQGGQGDESEPILPADEEAAWEQIVAGYGEEPDAGAPDDTPGGDHETGQEDGHDRGGQDARGSDTGDAGAGRPARSFTVYAAGTGPRDWHGPDDPEDDHFVPPEPPPLPETDTTTKFAWTAALGGPLLLLGAVLLDFYLTWWILTLGVGGFLGGFATLLTRLRDDDFDDPGGGAVV